MMLSQSSDDREASSQRKITSRAAQQGLEVQVLPSPRNGVRVVPRHLHKQESSDNDSVREISPENKELEVLSIIKTKKNITEAVEKLKKLQVRLSLCIHSTSPG